MSEDSIRTLQLKLEMMPAEEIVCHVLGKTQDEAVVTTNFRPFESVILHLVTRVRSNIPVLWVDHGSNLPETYRFAEHCREKLQLNLKAYLPRISAANWLALNGGSIPMPDEVGRVESFSRIMKLEPFERGMAELAPKIWITALRREQNPTRAQSLQIVQWDAKFRCIKVNPLLDWTTQQLEAYLAEYGLPNERTYYDPAKGDEKHECGLHAPLTTDHQERGI